MIALDNGKMILETGQAIYKDVTINYRLKRPHFGNTSSVKLSIGASQIGTINMTLFNMLINHKTISIINSEGQIIT